MDTQDTQDQPQDYKPPTDSQSGLQSSVGDDHIVEVVRNYLKGAAFSDRKVTDTPTDALQVVPKKYVDSVVGGLLPSAGTAGNVLTSNGSVFLSSSHSSIYGRMYLNGVQSVVSNSPNYEKVNYDTANFSSGLSVDTANHRFRVSIAGTYIVNGAVQYEQPNTVGTVCSAAVYVNSSVVSLVWSQVAINNLNITPVVTDIVNLNSNDFVEIYTTKSFSDGLLQNGTAQTYASISKI